MKLGVEVLTGSLFYVEIDEEETVCSLKKKIASKMEIEASRILLTHRDGHLLKDDQCSLSEYDCRDGSNIYLFFTTPPPECSSWPTTFQDYMSL